MRPFRQFKILDDHGATILYMVLGSKLKWMDGEGSECNEQCKKVVRWLYNHQDPDENEPPTVTIRHFRDMCDFLDRHQHPDKWAALLTSGGEGRAIIVGRVGNDELTIEYVDHVDFKGQLSRAALNQLVALSVDKSIQKITRLVQPHIRTIRFAPSPAYRYVSIEDEMCKAVVAGIRNNGWKGDYKKCGDPAIFVKNESGDAHDDFKPPAAYDDDADEPQPIKRRGKRVLDDDWEAAAADESEPAPTKHKRKRVLGDDWEESQFDASTRQRRRQPIGAAGFYCVRCRQATTGRDVHRSQTRKGQPMLKGQCARCGTRVNRFIQKT